jgi:hypothetical protein
LDEETAMGALRKQMDGDLVVRGMSVRTREAYLGAVAGLAKYYGRRPDRVSEAEVQKCPACRPGTLRLVATLAPPACRPP